MTYMLGYLLNKTNLRRAVENVMGIIESINATTIPGKLQKSLKNISKEY